MLHSTEKCFFWRVGHILPKTFCRGAFFFTVSQPACVMMGAQRRMQGFHESLRIGRTMITNEDGYRLAEDGLFVAEKGRRIDPYSFLGFYTGNWSEATTTYRGVSRHVFEADGWRIKPRLGAQATERVLDIICRVNEPPWGRTANCDWVRFVNEAELLVHGDKRRPITAVLACIAP